MKKNWIILNCVLILAILLTACGSKNNASTASTDSAATASQNGEFKLPLQTQLIIGTFALEKSDYAVTKEQAQELLPLWKVLKNLLGSDSASSVEIDALVNQIQESMTADQLAYISDQVSSPESYQAILSEHAPDSVQFGNFANMTDDERQARRETAVASGGGQFPGGAIPGGGQFQGGVPGTGAGGDGQFPQGDFVSETPGTGTTARTGGFGGSQINITLIEALIELLSNK